MLFILNMMRLQSALEVFLPLNNALNSYFYLFQAFHILAYFETSLRFWFPQKFHVEKDADTIDRRRGGICGQGRASSIEAGFIKGSSSL